jgi:methionyl-tRNA formyltransferase
MKLIFAGTPEFAERALSALHVAGHDVRRVLTRPDKPAGRGKQLVASPVKLRAQALGLPVCQPASLRDPAVQTALAAEAVDLMVVAAYGLILPQPVLDIPRLGCLNIHASLLPRWRGAAPIQRAIEAGDTQTGVTIMQMDAGLDTGAILLARALPIAADETGGTLHDRLAALGAELIVQALRDLEGQALKPVPQPAAGITYAAKLDKAESAIEWRLPAEVLERRLRAFDPFPGSSARIAGREAQPLKIWRGRVIDLPPGLSQGDCARVFLPGPGEAAVVCGERALALLELQKPGGRRLAVAEFLRGAGLSDGDRFELPG